ncbi:MAG: cytochrome c oxidase subunit I [Acidobacteria bacterium]|nr:MAG: cytochrome c oxidase subunit I [Acidobacteriota bacterium]
MSESAGAGHHEAPAGFLRKWVFSLDHKVIGAQYWWLGLIAVYVGMVLSLYMRFQLAWPGRKMPLVGTVMLPEQYLALVTMHGTIMVFFVLTTVPQSGFGNSILPIQIGAADMAFPVLNMLSFWTTFVSFAVMIASFFVTAGAPIGGWTVYAPLSALGESAGPGQGMGMNLWIISIFIFCVASLMGALNFIVTTLDLRTKGLSLMRLPLTVWAWFTTAILGLLAFAVLMGACVLLMLDRVGGTSFFIPAGLVLGGKVVNHKGGSPLLWQHLFWFFGHPEVYIAILPGMGIASQVLSTFCRKPIFGYRAMVFAILGIAVLSTSVWGHHMFLSGMNPYTAFAFSILTVAIGVPSAIKTFNWLGTIWRGRVQFATANLFAIGFVSLFVTGGITGIFLAQPAVDLPLHDTHFVVAHFHLVMGVAAIFGMFAGTFYWFPKIYGRMMNETLGKIHFWITLVGVYCIFFPLHFQGIAGQPRRYYSIEAYQFLKAMPAIHHFVSISAIVTIAAQTLFLINIFWSLAKGRRAEMNPWRCTTLEWTVPSPPPHDNFGGHPPQVYRGAYEYSVPGAREDFVLQSEAEAPVSRH